jgi:L-threonylcarbamoyladenylate synthase
MDEFDTEMLPIDHGLIREGKLAALLEDPAVKRAAKLLRRGWLVAFPTETVYGLGADASDAAAARKIYAAKGRPQDNPLIVHIANLQQLHTIIKGEVNAVGRRLMERFWPGPLTLIFNKSEMIPDGTTAGLDSVAVRMPDHPLARAVIERAGVPVAAPSANTSGAPSPTRAEHVLHDLKGKIPLILDGGATPVGVESTVVDVRDGKVKILRPGGVSREAIGELFAGEPGLLAPYQRASAGEGSPATAGRAPAADRLPVSEAPLAPGMKYRHYAPDTPLHILRDEWELKEKIQDCAARKIGFLLTDESYTKYRDLLEACTVLTMGPAKRPEIIAAGLFDLLRGLDALSLDVVYIELVSESGIGEAVMNRLYKASRGD